MTSQERMKRIRTSIFKLDKEERSELLGEFCENCGSHEYYEINDWCQCQWIHPHNKLYEEMCKDSDYNKTAYEMRKRLTDKYEKGI